MQLYIQDTMKKILSFYGIAAFVYSCQLFTDSPTGYSCKTAERPLNSKPRNMILEPFLIKVTELLNLFLKIPGKSRLC